MDPRVFAVLIALVIIAILFAFFGRRERAPPIREVIVREEVSVAWLPWSWGYGGRGRGTTYVDRPHPRFPWPRNDGGHHSPPHAGGHDDGTRKFIANNNSF